MTAEIKRLRMALHSSQKVVLEQEQKIVSLENRNTELEGVVFLVIVMITFFSVISLPLPTISP